MTPARLLPPGTAVQTTRGPGRIVTVIRTPARAGYRVRIGREVHRLSAADVMEVTAGVVVFAAPRGWPMEADR